MWVIEYWNGSSWVQVSGQLISVTKKLNSHEEARFLIGNTSANREFVDSDRRVRIRWGSYVVFDGKMYGGRVKRNEIECVVYQEAYETLKRKVTGAEEFTNTSISDILSWVLSGTGVVKGGTPVTTMSVRFEKANCYDAVRFLAEACSSDFMADYDSSGNPRIHILSRTNDEPYPQVHPVQIPEKVVDRAKKVTKVIVRGVDSNGNTIYGEAGAGDLVAVFTEKKAMDVTTLNNIAQKKLQELNTDYAMITLPLKISEGYNLEPGYYVYLNIPEVDLVGNYRIYKVVKKLDVVEIEVGKMMNLLEDYIDRLRSYEDYGIYVITPPFSLDLEPGAPSTPTGLTAVGGINSITLSWNANPEKDISHYVVYRGTSPQPTTAYAKVNTTVFVDTNVTHGTTYYYRIKAVDYVGNTSDYSSTVSASPRQVESIDLAPNSVTAEKILDGAVNDLKLASGSVTLTKFASGLRPVQIVGSLPTLPNSDYPVGSLVYLYTNGKLYKNVSETWVQVVNTSDLEGQITETQISDNSISTPKLKANAVTSEKIAANSITGSHIQANSIATGHIQAGAIGTDQLASNSITASKIQAGAVTSSKLAVAQIFIEGLTWYDNTPSSGYISWSSCTVYYGGVAYNISAGSTNNKYIYWSLGNTSFTTSNTKPSWSDYTFMIAINDNGYHRTVWNATYIHGGTLITGTITAQEISAGSITGDRLASRTITADKIATGTITASEIATNTITVSNLSSAVTDRMFTDSSTKSVVEGWRYSTTTYIDGGDIYTGTITADKIASRTITADKIATGTITANEITSDWITGKKFRTSSSYPMITFDSSEIAGYNSSGTKQFYINASDGRGYCAGGNVSFRSDGIWISHPSSGVSPSLRFTVAGTTIGSMYALGDDNSLNIVMQSSSYPLTLSSGTRYIVLRGNGAIEINPGVSTSYMWRIDYTGSDPRIRTNTANYGIIGTSSQYIYQIFCSAGYYTSLLPLAGDNTGSLGSSGSRWANFYAVNKNASFPHPRHNPKCSIVFTCVESPKVIIEDFGVAQLVDGEAFVLLSEEFVALKSDTVEYSVFLQPEGECNGLMVVSKELHGFKVKEMNGGKSNVSFSWLVKAIRVGDEDRTPIELEKPKPESKEEEESMIRLENTKFMRKEQERLERMGSIIDRYRLKVKEINMTNESNKEVI